MSPTQAAGYKVRIPTVTLLLHTPPVNKFCFIIDDFLDEPQYVIIDISNRLFMVDPIFVLYGFRC